MRFTPATRISLGLVSLTISLLLLGKLIGFAPDRTGAVIDSRKNISEALAIQFSAAAQKGDIPLNKETLRSMVERDNAIRSAAMRKAQGGLLAEAGNSSQERRYLRMRRDLLQMDEQLGRLLAFSGRME